MLPPHRSDMRQASKNTCNQASAVLSDEKFRQGIINSVDYLVSKTNLIVAESELLQSKFNLIFSYKVLDFYSGITFTIKYLNKIFTT
jgi:outer membrane protein